MGIINPGDLFTGVVCSLKDNYGFIERSDVVKELFFHFSEFQGNVEASTALEGSLVPS